MTNLLYLQNPDLYQATAKILEIREIQDILGIVLDQTIFYVQGGGQPGDIGFIFTDNSKFEVTKTIYDEVGTPIHLGSFITGSFEINQIVQLDINSDNRILNSKIHSSGHLIDLAIKNLGLDWKPTKGFHYPEGSYVEYKSDTLTSNLESIKSQIQEEYDKLVSQNISIIITFDNAKLYKGQPLRSMSFEGFGQIPCGGTHAKSTLDLIDFKITKIKVKSGLIKVSYGLTKLKKDS